MKLRLLSALFTIGLIAMGCQEDSDLHLNNDGGSGAKHDGSSGKGDSGTDNGGRGEGNGGSGEGNGGSGEGNGGSGEGNGGSGEGNGGSGEGNGGSGEGNGGSAEDVLPDWMNGMECFEDYPSCYDERAVACVDGRYTVVENCAGSDKMCVDGYGCVVCNPDTTYCKEDGVYECNADGTAETRVQTCMNGCYMGACLDDCSEDSKFIYLVDTNYNLIKFNPGDKNKNYLTVLFHLDCGNLDSTPFSMAVDRKGNAWVLYSDTTLYKVNISLHTCSKVIKFIESGIGLSTFGMAFVSESVGSSNDVLFIAGNQRFGRIDTDTMTYTPLAGFPSNYEQTPELTGTGNSQLFSFAPGAYEQQITEIDKATGDVIKNYSVPGPGSSTNAWAFAHWGGYYFTMQTSGSGNQIYRFNPKTNEFNLFIDQTNYRVVGAGVSTCAPTEVVN